jgi:serine/threonine protein kinase
MNTRNRIKRTMRKNRSTRRKVSTRRKNTIRRKNPIRRKNTIRRKNRSIRRKNRSTRRKNRRKKGGNPTSDTLPEGSSPVDEKPRSPVDDKPSEPDRVTRLLQWLFDTKVPKEDFTISNDHRLSKYQSWNNRIRHHANKVIGKGAEGIVYPVTQNQPISPYAIKKILLAENLLDKFWEEQPEPEQLVRVGKSAYGSEVQTLDDCKDAMENFLKEVEMTLLLSNLAEQHNKGMKHMRAKQYFVNFDISMADIIRTEKDNSPPQECVSIKPEQDEQGKYKIHGYILMKNRGISLHDFKKKYAAKLIPENVVRPIAKQIFNFIRLCSQNNIVHHDIKPGNILILDHDPWVANLQAVLPLPTITVVDFDTTFVIDNYADFIKDRSQPMGTSEYLAPEIVELAMNGKPYSLDKVDIYSFGVTLVDLCCGWDNDQHRRRRGVAGALGFLDQGWKDSLLTMTEKAVRENKVSTIFQDLIKGLLNFEEQLTLDQIRGHPWFLGA